MSTHTVKITFMNMGSITARVSGSMEEIREYFRTGRVVDIGGVVQAVFRLEFI